jgi:hypothetical protein
MGRFVMPNGGERSFRATRDPSSGEVTVSSDLETSSLPPAGAQLALADIDGDGNPEIASSLDVLDPATDALVISSLQPGKSPQERFRVAVPSGVRAITTCPADGPGPAPIVLATNDGLWVVR